MPYDPATNPLNSREWVFPVLEVFHISCFAASIGLITVVNLRLWGSVFAGTTAKALNRQLFLWTLAGLTIVLLAGMMLWQAITKERFYRAQFFLTFFLCWIILGTLLAYYFSSAGPCFYGFYSNDTHNPFIPLMSYLDDHAPSWIIELQKVLLMQLLSGSLIFGGGVSAMPSMHLSMATLFYLVCSKHNKWLGRFALGYLVLILIGCVHLAWHYAVDCYVGIIVTAMIWWGVGRVLRGVRYETETQRLLTSGYSNE